MKNMGAKEFYNDVIPNEVDKELTALDGFQYHDYLSDNVDLHKVKVRQYLVEVGNNKTIYQVVSDATHGEVGVFTTGEERPFAHMPLNKSVEPEEQGVQDVIMEKVESANTEPYISEVVDINSGKANTVLTAGGIVELTGSRLKFDAADPQQGLFFIPENTGEETHCTIVAENKPARIMGLIPGDLAPGTYHVEVRTKYTPNGKALHNMKTGRFSKALTRTT